MPTTTDPARRPRRGRHLRLVPLALLVLTSLLTLAPANASAPRSAATAAPDLSCGVAEVTRTLPTGSAWRMCVRVHDFTGLVAESIQFKPATGSREYDGWLPVIDSLTLAQLHVPYDHGLVGFNDVTGTGLGGPQLVAQNATTCAGTTIPVEQSLVSGSAHIERTIPGICLATTSTGLAWHAQDDVGVTADRYDSRGSALEVSSLSRVGWYEYQQRYTFTDQGQITVALGATGDIGQSTLLFPTDPALGWQVGPATTTTTTETGQPGAASHWHNAIYRVDFGIGAGPQQVQRWDYAPSSTSAYRLDGVPTTEARALIAPADTPRTTWWRVLNPASLNPDGHPRSYEIANDTVQDSFWSMTDFKVAFTNAAPCQQYAWDNLDAGCPGEGISDYVRNDAAPLTDPVAWINTGFHHIVRDEDQSPMPTHWQEFSLVPRDLLAQQATTPPERSCINGGPLSPGGSCAAVSTAAPVLSATPGPLRPGSVLTTSLGTWKAARGLLRFQYLWLRDGAPLTATGPDGLASAVTTAAYTLTAADQGHRISVRIFASAAGIIPGAATSDAVLVPAAPRPTTHPSPTRVAPHLSLDLRRRHHRAILTLTVGGRLGPATGRVEIRGRGWTRVRNLSGGRVRVTVRTRALRTSSRVRVSYAGSSVYLPLRRSWTVAHLLRQGK
ncbi:hypothetical protein [Nocardioides sp.]|uniref:copper amine oxidase n=1 Tax=Nocardioides sp. TaxID=35761 RepID=UPI002615CF17|nr:hypothetical protein [Nocardioides sp.]